MTTQLIVPVAQRIVTPELDRQLRAGGVPIEGIAYNSKEGWVRVDFLDSVTQQQIDAAIALVNAHTGVDPVKVAQADIRARWLASTIHGKDPTQIYTAVQGAIDGWTSLAAAKADLRVWLPLAIAALAWEVMKNEQR
jgi:creatinine amidohydrolase/Fe(II)-dependent formamide hydrolase-like protein